MVIVTDGPDTHLHHSEVAVRFVDSKVVSTTHIPDDGTMAAWVGNRAKESGATRDAVRVDGAGRSLDEEMVKGCMDTWSGSARGA